MTKPTPIDTLIELLQEAKKLGATEVSFYRIQSESKRNATDFAFDSDSVSNVESLMCGTLLEVLIAPIKD